MRVRSISYHYKLTWTSETHFIDFR